MRSAHLLHDTSQLQPGIANMDDTADWLLDPDSWQNGSLMFNQTAANSSVYVGMSPGMNKAINVIMVVVLTQTMVSLGCTMELSKIKKHIVKPKGVAIAVVSQYGVMPLTGFCLAKAFKLSGITAVAILICGCCPGGSLSNLLALALQGDMNLSIVMTCCSTILALGMMPLLLFIYCRAFPNLPVPYVDIVISLVLILIPCGVGIFINHRWPKIANVIEKVGLSIFMLTIVLIGILASIGIGGSILTVFAPSLMAVSVLMPLIGYSFGYIISTLFKLNQSERRTVAMETGCQNIQLAATILKMAFPQNLIGPLFLFPLVFGFLQLIEAAVLIVLFRGYQWYTNKDKDTAQLQSGMASMDSRAHLLPDRDLWQNGSLMFNQMAANTSFGYTEMSPGMNKAINAISIVFLILVLISMGCTMELSRIKEYIVKPKGVAIGLLSQYGVMPLTAFCLAKVFQLSDITAVVVLICGCCPGGTLSNILTLALQGDMNLSIVMTCCSTVTALGMMPLLLFIYCQGFPHLQKYIPYVKIIISLIMILIPCIIGFLINHYRPKYARIVKQVGLIITSILVLVIIVMLFTIDVVRSHLSILPPAIVAISALMPLIGFTFGYIISSLFKFNQAERRAVAMETGTQNVQLCFTLLKVAFPSDTIGLLFLVPMAMQTFQVTEAALLIILSRCYTRFSHRKKGDYKPTEPSEESAP
ncbi:uncharacterized protein V6R79_012446 [Siganus canaliculatus]